MVACRPHRTHRLPYRRQPHHRMEGILPAHRGSTCTRRARGLAPDERAPVHCHREAPEAVPSPSPQRSRSDPACVIVAKRILWQSGRKAFRVSRPRARSTKSDGLGVIDNHRQSPSARARHAGRPCPRSGAKDRRAKQTTYKLQRKDLSPTLPVRILLPPPPTALRRMCRSGIMRSSASSLLCTQRLPW